MARLKAKEKVLFYPTPLDIVETIASNIIPRAPGPDERAGAILDPCAGTGEPLAILGNHLGLAAMDLDEGNLMDALMKAVVQGRPKHVEWSGMQVAEVTRRMSLPHPPLQPALPQEEPEALLEISEVALEGGAIQYSFL